MTINHDETTLLDTNDVKDILSVLFRAGEAWLDELETEMEPDEFNGVVYGFQQAALRVTQEFAAAFGSGVDVSYGNDNDNVGVS